VWVSVRGASWGSVRHPFGFVADEACVRWVKLWFAGCILGGVGVRSFEWWDGLVRWWGVLVLLAVGWLGVLEVGVERVEA